jgi:hypothetical protein
MGFPDVLGLLRSLSERAMKPSKLIGRTIVAVDLQRVDNGRGGFVDDPRITFDDGSTLEFLVQEGEHVYGVRLIHTEKGSQ